MTKLKDYIWDKLFLDFYLDKRFSWRFKLVNWLMEDELRAELVSIIYDAEICGKFLNHVDGVPEIVQRKLDKIAESADYLLDV